MIQTVWILSGPGVSPFQAYCGDVGFTLAMLIKCANSIEFRCLETWWRDSTSLQCSGAFLTFRYQASVWTAGWDINQALG